MAANSTTAALAVTSLGQTVAVFPVFLPSLQDVRKASRDDSLMRGDVRLGEFAATSVAVSVGLVLSNLSDSSLPLFTSAIMAAVIVAVYEYAMQGERVME